MPEILHRGEREVLPLGHLQGHRFEVLQEARAAETAAARTDSTLAPGRLALVDLPQLDPRAEDPREIAHERHGSRPVRRP